MPLWGFADLHAHPASHMGFGANDNGEGGIFWGKPGLGREEAERNPAADLQPCITDKHAGFDEDKVRHETRQTIIGRINQLTGLSHVATGWPTFEGWPHALSVLHQQMHVSWIHRAWQGGLRLMIASVTDNQTLAMLWHRGYNVHGSHPRPDPGFDMRSARRQLAFIRRMAQANAAWMEVVETPAQARAAISANRLALVLSLEMDSLTAEQIVSLKRELGVRHVIPIHLADNAFGGTAVYEDQFNTHNYFLNERFLHVTGDPHLEFRLGMPEYPAVAQAGSVQPKRVERAEYCALGYECCPEAPRPGCIPAGQGHRNVRGLEKAELRKLMAEGMLIDLAHMSEAAQADALELAASHTYPVMNSHTGLRADGRRARSERSMKRSHAEAVARLGGMIGLGTEGSPRGRTVLLAERSAASPVVRFKGDHPEWTVALPDTDRADTPVSRLNVTIRTGGDDLRRNSQAFAVVRLRSGRTLDLPLNGGANWPNGSVNTVRLDLPRGTRMGDLRSFGMRYMSGKDLLFDTTDNWNVDELRVEYEVLGGTLVNLRGVPLVRFTGDRRVWTTPTAAASDAPATRLHVTIRTGGDDLRRNSQAVALVGLRDGQELSFPLNSGQGWGNGSVNVRTIALPPGTRVVDLRSLGIRHASGSTGIFDQYDNWNVDEVRVDYDTRSGTLLHLTGAPLMRFQGEQPERLFWAHPPAPVPADASASHLRVTVHTGGDDLRQNSQAWALVGLRGRARLEFPLNRGANWGNGSVYRAILALPADARLADLETFGIRYVSGRTRSTDTTDNWTVDRVQVEVLDDPVAGWIAEYAEALGVMQNRGVALGTDMNGYAPQVPFSKTTVPYPVDVATRLAPAGTAAPALPRCRVGNRTFDFTADGLAHYGMLPDFLQAVGRHASAAGHLAPLFRTAEDVVQMWERAEAAAEQLGRISRPAGTVPLDLYWSDARGDNFTTCTDVGRRDAEAAGYRFVRTEGYVFPARQAGAVPLDLFWSGERGDNFCTTTDTGRRDAAEAGYRQVRTEGFVLSTQLPGTVPLKLYWNEPRADNFITATGAGSRDAEAAGYAFIRVEGYVYPRAVGLRTHGGQFVGAEGGGGGAVDARRARLGEHETFEVVYLGPGKIALRTRTGHYLCAEAGGGREVVANRTWIGDWEDFDIVHVGGSRVALRVQNGQYVCAEGGGGRELVANRSRIDIWETFELLGA